MEQVKPQDGDKLCPWEEQGSQLGSLPIPRVSKVNQVRALKTKAQSGWDLWAGAGLLRAGHWLCSAWVRAQVKGEW